MIRLNLPEFEFKITKKDKGFYIFDEIRKKNVKLTPEEWVRQNFLKYLFLYKNYPVGLTSIEKKIIVNNTIKRFDAVIFNTSAQPILILECKAPQIKLDNCVCEQIANYNKIIKSPIAIITNGLTHYCFAYDYKKNESVLVNEIPDYS